MTGMATERSARSASLVTCICPRWKLLIQYDRDIAQMMPRRLAIAIALTAASVSRWVVFFISNRKYTWPSNTKR